MNRYFLHLAYNGAAYRGWQEQPNVVSVQKTIKDAVGQLLRKPVKIMGCGRTDASVHASQYFIHFNFEKEIPDQFVYKLNLMLPRDIIIFEWYLVERNAHVQRDVSARTYQYIISGKKNPFINTSSSYYPMDDWDFEKMEAAVDIISTQKDFRSMCKRPDDYEHTLCDLTQLKLERNTQTDLLKITITSDRFLQAMVRLIVGSLMAVANGKLSLEQLEENFKTGIRPRLIDAAYPQGLYLSRIEYPFLDVPPESKMSYRLY